MEKRVAPSEAGRHWPRLTGGRGFEDVENEERQRESHKMSKLGRERSPIRSSLPDQGRKEGRRKRCPGHPSPGREGGGGLVKIVGYGSPRARWGFPWSGAKMEGGSRTDVG